MLLYALSILGLVTMVPLAFVSFGIRYAFDGTDALRRFRMDLLRDICPVERVLQVEDD